MPRRPRVSAAGSCYHVLNRGVGPMTLFDNPEDYAVFEKAVAHAYATVPMRVLAYVLMPNHWHLVLWPSADEHLSEFIRLLTVTHTQRWHAHRHTAGTGPVYQGRFKSFSIQQDDHLLTALQYVQRNPVRAGLCDKAEDWPWGEACHDGRRASADRPAWLLAADAWPVARRRDWRVWVDRPQMAKEEETVRQCVRRGRPYGADGWVAATAERLEPASTLRSRGRPRKSDAGGKAEGSH